MKKGLILIAFTLALGVGFAQTLSFEKQSVYDGIGIINHAKHLTDIQTPVEIEISKELSQVVMRSEEGVTREFKLISIEGARITLDNGSLINLVYKGKELVSAALYDRPDRMWYVMTNSDNSNKNKDNTLRVLSLELTE